MMICNKITTYMISSILLSLLVSGCASNATGPDFVLEKPLPDEAVIYHYRLEAFRTARVIHKVLQNDKPLVLIGNGGYFKQISKPGTIKFKSKLSVTTINIFEAIDNVLADFDDRFELVVEAGKTYFIQWKIFKMYVEPESKALNDMEGLKMFPIFETED